MSPDELRLATRYRVDYAMHGGHALVGRSDPMTREDPVSLTGPNALADALQEVWRVSGRPDPLGGDPETWTTFAWLVLSKVEAYQRAAGRIAAASPADGAGHRPEWRDGVPTGWCECGKPHPHVGAVPPPPRAGVDVGRLARALWAWGFDATGPVIRDDVKGPTEGQRRMARKLATEYDRLAALEGASDGETP